MFKHKNKVAAISNDSFSGSTTTTPPQQQGATFKSTIGTKFVDKNRSHLLTIESDLSPTVDYSVQNDNFFVEHGIKTPASRDIKSPEKSKKLRFGFHKRRKSADKYITAEGMTPVHTGKPAWGVDEIIGTKTEQDEALDRLVEEAKFVRLQRKSSVRMKRLKQQELELEMASQPDQVVEAFSGAVSGYEQGHALLKQQNSFTSAKSMQLKRQPSKGLLSAGVSPNIRSISSISPSLSAVSALSEVATPSNINATIGSPEIRFPENPHSKEPQLNEHGLLEEGEYGEDYVPTRGMIDTFGNTKLLHDDAENEKLKNEMEFRESRYIPVEVAQGKIQQILKDWTSMKVMYLRSLEEIREQYKQSDADDEKNYKEFVEGFRARYASLKKKFTAKRIECKKLIRHIDQLRETNQMLRMSNSDGEAIEDIVLEKHELINKNQTQKKLFFGLVSHLKRVENQAAEHLKTIEAREQDIQGLQAKMEETNKALEEARQDDSSQVVGLNNKVELLNNKLKLREEMIAQLKEDLKELRNAVPSSPVLNENNELVAQLKEQLETAQSEIAQLRTTNMQSQQLAENAQLENSQLENAKEKVEPGDVSEPAEETEASSVTNDAQLSALTTSLTVERELVKKLQAELDHVRDLLRASNSIKAENERLSQELKKKEKQVMSEKEPDEDSADEPSETEPSESERSENKLTEENTSKHYPKDEPKEDHPQEAVDPEEMEKLKKQLETEHAAIVSDLNEKLSAEQQTVTELKERLAEVERTSLDTEEMINIQRKLMEKDAYIQKAQSQFKKLKSAYLAIKASQEDSHRTITELRQQLENGENTSKSAAQELVNLTKENTELHELHDKTLKQLEEQHGVVEQLKSEKVKLLAAVTKLKEAATTAEKLKKALKKFSSKYDALNDKHTELEAKHKSLKKAAKEIDSLHKNIKSLSDEKDDLTSKLKEANSVKKEAVKKQKEQEELLIKEQGIRRKYYNQIQDAKGKIRVYCRVRPFNSTEKEAGYETTVGPIDDSSFDLIQKKKKWEFSRVFYEDTTQAEVFQDTKDLISSCFDGYNVCVFAYGQTGSGKTFTISGVPTDENLRGILPRSINEIFSTISNKRFNKLYDTKVSSTMVELYLDEIYDLYAPKKKKRQMPDHQIKKDRNGNVVITNVVIKPAESAEDLFEHYTEGLGRRHVRSTKMNAESSRSHLVFTVIVETHNKSNGNVRFGKLSLVDLAGSEKSSKTGVDAAGAREATAINKSLSALKDVIAALCDKSTHIPYRNNKLTMLLSDSLGGVAKTLMFVNIGPAEYNLEETNNSLLYADRVKSIKNEVARASETKRVRKLNKKVKKLQEIIEYMKTHGGEMPKDAHLD